VTRRGSVERASVHGGFGAARATLHAGDFHLALTEHAPDLALPEHAHERACVHYVVRGVYRERQSGADHCLAARHALFKPAGTRHANTFDGGGSFTLRIEFPAAHSVLDSLAPRELRDPRVLQLTAQLLLELTRSDDLTPLAVEGACLELTAALARELKQVHEASACARDALADRAAQRLRERFAAPLRLHEIAKELGVDRTQLARAFRARLRCTMVEYLRMLRVQAVRSRLESTTESLSEIALSAGFADQSHCARSFRRVMGLSPGAYRRSRQDSRALD